MYVSEEKPVMCRHTSLIRVNKTDWLPGALCLLPVTILENDLSINRGCRSRTFFRAGFILRTSFPGCRMDLDRYRHTGNGSADEPDIRW
jgi:hypothetical protein